MTIPRSSVNERDQWNVQALYKDIDSWEEAFKAFTESHSIQKLNQYKGQLTKDTQNLKEATLCFFDASRTLHKLFTWAHLRHDEDITDELFKTAYQKIMFLYHQFMQASSWIQPELLQSDEEQLRSLITSPELDDYRFFFEKIIRLKPHTLTIDQEELLALSAQALDSPHLAFTAINNADFAFGTVEDSLGKQHPLTHASYGLFLRHQDRTLRKNSFETMHNQYLHFENSLTELLTGHAQGHLFSAKARKYPSCLESALFDKNIPIAVYQSLIEAVRSNISVLHKYMALRKQALGLDEMHLWDVYVPFVEKVDIQFTYEEAEALVIESVAPLGKEYQEILKKGLQQDRWVDRYENKNKRSGAYSSGCYDSMPYILMNYKGILRDVFTLAHEAGHSMHSFLSKKKQPYHYADYEIFVAEVASTFNEELLTQTMLQKVKNPLEKAYLINEKLEDIRATLFRQTMFAEFELFIHTMLENGTPLTPNLLKEKFLELNQFYFGEEVIIDSLIGIEWARIPHFYANFYVYQYATGISAALALAEKVLSNDSTAKDRYLEFLSSGGSAYPIDLLKRAGIDMQTKEPVLHAIQRFERGVSSLELLLKEDLKVMHSIS